MLKVMLLVLGLISPFSGSSAYSYNQPEVSMDVFETVNDISLWNQKEDVLQKKGEPLQVNEIPFLECMEYEYTDMVVGICDGWVGYVHVDESVGTFEVNGYNISMNEKEITKALGVPQFHAEDGEVYIRGDQAIKVYKDPATEAIQGIDFFDESST